MKRCLRFGLLSAVTVLLWITLVDRPQAPDGSLGASWESALGVIHRQHGQFGKEVIFTAGPWGFLTSDYVVPEILGEKIAWERVGKFLLALGLVLLSGAIAGPARWLFLAAIPLVRGWYPDVPLDLFLVLAVLVWVLPERVAPPRRLLAILALAFLAQIKFTYCLLAAAGIAVAAVAELLRGRGRGASAIAGGFLLAFLLFWLAAGQNPVRLYDYFRYSLEISRGYALAMGIEETHPVLLAALAVLALNVAFLRQLWRNRPPTSLARSAAVFLAVAGYLIWRHGFIRADTHVHVFFALNLLLALALPGLFGLPRSGWLYLNVALCALGGWLADPGLVRSITGRALDRHAFAAQAGVLFHPAALRADFAAAWDRNASAQAMPEVQAAVGTHSIDLINFEQGVLWLNGLQPRLRPVFQSYSAYTPPLMAKNLRFFQSGRAPEFVLLRLNSIDYRLPAEDDALVLAELPRRYDFVLQSDHGLLLRRRPLQPSVRDFRREPIFSQKANVGETLSVPAETDHALWLQVEFTLSPLVQFRSYWYRPPVLWLVITDQNQRETRYRIVPSVAAEGFLLQPLLEDTSDYAKFIQGIGWKWAKTLRFEAERGEERYWRTGFVRFSRIPELPVTVANPMAEYVEAGITNLIPQSVHSEVGTSLTGRGADSELLVHAPGRVEFAPPPELRRLRGSFGIKPGAYTGEGRTDGAEFVIQATLKSGRVQELWRRWLRPVTLASDRGRQSFALALPAGTTRLTLLTLPGPQGDSQWDWTYWCALEFSP